MYRLILFGGIDLVGPSGPLSGRSVQPRPLAVLALLTRASAAPLARGKAVGILWPDVPEGKARRRLSDALYAIRRELGEEVVVSVADRLRLNPEVICADVTLFEEAVREGHLEEAVKRYAGPFLDGFHLPNEAEFDRWMEGERRRLAEAYREVLERLAQRAEREGDWPGAASWWKRRAAAELTDSRVAVRFMRALVSAGNTPRALQHARIHEGALRDELGLPPPEEVRALAKELAETEERPRGSEGRAHHADADQPPRDGAARPRPRESHEPLHEVVVGGAGPSAALGARPANVMEGSFPSLAILPFETVGPADDDHFAQGMTEELVACLAPASGLQVIDCGGLPEEDGGEGAREMAEALGVDYALEGTVRWEHRSAGERPVRVTPRLIRVSDGAHLWAKTYDGESAEILGVQADIAEWVVRELRLTLGRVGAEAPEARSTRVPEAWNHFLQGNAYLARQFSGDAVRAAIGQYERAVERDPRFAEAWRRLIHARLLLAWVLDVEAAGLEARADVERLAELDPDDPEVRLARACFHHYGGRDYGAVPASR